MDFSTFICKKPGHNNRPIQLFNFSDNKDDLFLCSKCMIKVKNGKYFVLDELMGGKVSKSEITSVVCNKNDDQEPIYDLKYEQKKIIDEINYKMDEIQDQLQKSFETMKKKLLILVDEFFEENTKYQKEFEKSIDISKLQESIAKYYANKIDLEEVEKYEKQFSTDIQNNKKNFEQYDQFDSLLKNLKQSILIHQQEFQDTTKKLVILSETKVTIKNKLDFKFVKNTDQESQYIKELSPGIEFQGSQHSEYGIISSSESFTDGIHGFQIQMDNYDNSCFIFGIYSEEDAKNNLKPISNQAPWACLFNNCRNLMKNSNLNYKDFLYSIKRGDIIKVQLNFNDNSYTITDQYDKCKYELTNPQFYPFAGKKLKFYICFFANPVNFKFTIINAY